MKIKSKLFSVIFGTMLLIAVFALSVSAETPRGPSYDESHVDNGCCTVGSSGLNHYTEGYDDGYVDGKNSQQSTIDSMQSTIDSLKGNAGDNSDDEKPDDGNGGGGTSGGIGEGDESDEKPDDGNSGGGTSGGIGEGDESDEEADEEAYINYWKQKYLELYEEHEILLEVAARYKVHFDEANNRIVALGGDVVNDPLQGELEWTTVFDDVQKREAIDEYLNSEEYLEGQSIRETLIISNYKGSEEYQNNMQQQYILGAEIATEEMYNSAYAEAYDTVYSLGLADGYASYTGTEQYTKTLNKAQQSAYEQGYTEGYNLGSENSSEYEYDLTTIISLIIGVVALGGVLLAVALFTKKKKHRR